MGGATLPATGAVIATDLIASEHHQKVKMEYGAAGVALPQDENIATEDALQMVVALLAQLVSLSSSANNLGQTRVAIESGSVGIASAQTLATVTNVGGVATVTSLNQFGGQPVQQLIQPVQLGTIYDNLKVS